nr:MAG TPA: hypothetical protein [Caudoviricetes sp.]
MRDFREEREKLIMRYINNKIKDNINIFDYQNYYIDNKYYLYKIEFEKLEIIEKIKLKDSKKSYKYRFYIDIIENLFIDKLIDKKIYEIEISIKENDLLYIYFDNDIIIELNIKNLKKIDIYKYIKNYMIDYNQEFIDNIKNNLEKRDLEK